MLNLILSILFASSLAYGDVYSFPEKDFHVSTEIRSQQIILGFLDNATDKDVTYEPNVGILIVPKISCRGKWGLSWAFKVPVSEADKIYFGETDYNDVRFDFSFRKFTVNTYYSQYRGFYINKSEEIDSSLTQDSPRLQRPDLYGRSYGVAVTWVWDDSTFSLPNLISQAERQERSGGSLLFGASISETHYKSDASLIPNQLASQFNVLNDFTGGKFQTLQAKIGYGYSIATKWFLGGTIQLGPGLTRREFKYTNGETRAGWEPSVRAEVLASGGYNGDFFFTSLKIDGRNDILIVSNSSSQISTTLLSVGINFGIHLESIGM